MNFERGKDVKEALCIGAIATAPYIGILYRIFPEFPDPYLGDGQPLYISKRSTLHIVDGLEVVHILRDISAGNINPDDFAFELTETDVTTTPKLQFFHGWKGKYLKYWDRFMTHDIGSYDYNDRQDTYIFLIP